MIVRTRRALFAMALLLAVCGSNSPLVAANGTRIATPAASPVPTSAGCDQLEPYFRELAALIRPNDGLAILRTVNNDVLALTSTQAATVVTSLDDLIPRVQAVTPPAPAIAYQAAYVDYLTWYRDMAEHRDPASHQRLINADKRIIPAIGRATFVGQAACGAERWNAAQQAAFPTRP